MSSFLKCLKTYYWNIARTVACPRIILFGISEIFTRGKGNRCVAISIKKVAFFVIFRQNSLFCYPDVLCCKKISSLRFTIDLTRLLYFNIIILEYYFSHVLTGTLGFIFPLQFRRVSLLAMVPGANSPRSKGQDSSPIWFVMTRRTSLRYVPIELQKQSSWQLEDPWQEWRPTPIIRGSKSSHN